MLNIQICCTFVYAWYVWYFIKAPVASTAAHSEAEILLLLITTQKGACSNLMQTQTSRARDGNVFSSVCL